jgi:hypothetical protein
VTRPSGYDASSREKADTFSHQEDPPMVYFGYQVSPAPGKRDDLIEANARFKKVIESHGGKAIASFQVAIGQGEPMIASVSSSFLQPLPESGLQ